METSGVNPGSFFGSHTPIRPAADGFAHVCLSTPCSSCIATASPPVSLANPIALYTNLPLPHITMHPLPSLSALRRWRPR